MKQIDVIKLFNEISRELGQYCHLKFNNKRRALGSYHYDINTMYLSNIYIENNPIDVIRGTILHEFAHKIAGKHSGHGRKWKNVCNELGCRPSRTNTVAIIPYKYKGTCPNCGITHEAHRRRSVACSACCSKHNNGKFSSDYEIIYTENL